MSQRKIFTSFFIVVLLFATSKAFAQITIESIEIGTEIENRALVGESDSFPSNVTTLFCLTKITGADNSPTIKHIWYYGEEEKASTELEVRTPKFRTWSSKKIWHTWTGKWKVDVVDDAGNVLASKSFTIQ
tara:strand:+ start:167 stop:559 length:393 start_codon:yes stop_codon:yes gene_type:complete